MYKITGKGISRFLLRLFTSSFTYHFPLHGQSTGRSGYDVLSTQLFHRWFGFAPIRYDEKAAGAPLQGHSGTFNCGETLTYIIDVKWLWRLNGFLNSDSETLLPKVKQSRVGLKPMVLTYYGMWRITKTGNTWDTRTPISRDIKNLDLQYLI